MGPNPGIGFGTYSEPYQRTYWRSLSTTLSLMRPDAVTPSSEKLCTATSMLRYASPPPAAIEKLDENDRPHICALPVPDSVTTPAARARQNVPLRSGSPLDELVCVFAAEHSEYVDEFGT